MNSSMKNQPKRFVNLCGFCSMESSIKHLRQPYRKPFTTVAVIAMLILSSSGCQPLGNQPCGSTEESKAITSDFAYLTSDVREVYFTGIDETQEVVNLVIRTETDYKRYLATIQGDTLPTINFNEYILLAGRAKTRHSDLILSQSVVETCGETVYKVRIGGGIGTVPSVVSYFALVPAGSTNVRFDVSLE